jgi:hypothetical protein
MKAKIKRWLALRKPWKKPLPYCGWGRPIYSSEDYKRYEENQIHKVQDPELGELTIRFERNIKVPTATVWGMSEGKPYVWIELNGILHLHQSIAMTERFLHRVSLGLPFFRPGDKTLRPDKPAGNHHPEYVFTVQYCSQVSRPMVTAYTQDPYEVEYCVSYPDLQYPGFQKETTLWCPKAATSEDIKRSELEFVEARRAIDLLSQMLLETAVSEYWVYQEVMESPGPKTKFTMFGGYVSLVERFVQNWVSNGYCEDWQKPYLRYAKKRLPYLLSDYYSDELSNLSA